MNLVNIMRDNFEHVFAVIMAGGGGTRLWPISRKSHPKHVLPLIGDRTLFQSTFDRLNGFVSHEQIIVVTTSDQVDILRKQVPQILLDNILVEPTPRGTASVVGLAAVALEKRDPESVMAVLPSDHYIKNTGIFQQTLHNGISLAEDGYLVTIGISPTIPSTGYGYIQRKEPLFGNYDFPVFKVRRFTEKPDPQMAKKMVESGNYSWNSGMFIWRSDRILKEIDHYMPDLMARLKNISAAWNSPRRDMVLHSEWPQISPQTIDYGIMEQADNVAVLPADGLGWSDVGSWDSLFDVLIPDEKGNVVINNSPISFDSKGLLIMAPENKLVVTVGVDDLIIVDSGDSLLICDRKKAQDVRKVIEYLKSQNKHQYL
jgi:mannose-1-phosphate guanylyltransferase